MADNPFDPKYPFASLLGSLSSPPKKPDDPNSRGAVSPLGLGSLAGLFSSTPPAFGSLVPEPERSTNALARLIADAPAPKPSALSPYANLGIGVLSGVANPLSLHGLLAFVTPPAPPSSLPPPPARSFGSLGDLVSQSTNALYSPPKPKAEAPEVKRKAFFSFYFEDVMRVNNVRQAWKISHPDSTNYRSFYDSSLWESRKITDEEALKKLIRAGVLYTSAVCVLAGTMTWQRRWVRYEIARAIIDGRGLLTVHLNGLKHHQTRAPHPNGLNPLAFMAIGRHQPDASKRPVYYLYEKDFVSDRRGGWELGWVRYADHTAPVTLPSWVNDPGLHGYVMPLSVNAAEYNYVAENGHRNIGSWIDMAAKQAGR
jgi:MTH538 TIR-like domain (DUF1863)